MAIQFNNTGTGTVTLASPSSGTPSFTLPSADGTSGQVLQTNGSGVLSFGSAGAPTTAQVLSATAGATVGDVGTYAFLGETSNTTNTAAGGTRAGSSLRYANAGKTASGWDTNSVVNMTAVSSTSTATPSGTWRAMGDSRGSSSCCANAWPATLWLRIS